jgi:hypothetical protein
MNKTGPMRRALLVAVLTVLATSGASAAQNVTTIAGSGLTGSLDGPALSATFVFPVAVAYAANGELYIADAGAQRIRVLRIDGAVETLAGSGEPASPDGAVPGGFRNGPALSAQFNHPSAIVVRGDGTVLVADTLNHCIRAIKSGRVTTFAGQCGVDGKLDGALHAATFHLPVSVAIDSFGNIFVGDFNTGVRQIKNGAVSTMSLPASIQLDITSVSTVGAEAALHLIIVNRDGIYVYEPANGKNAFYRAGGYGARDSALAPWAFMEGYRSIGYPYALAPLGTLDFVYTDAWTNSVRVIRSSYTNAIAGNMSEDASATPSVFNAPLGIAKRPGGGYAVADSGNRRIRLVSADNPEQGAGAPDVAAAKNAYRIVLIGNSHILYNSDWDHSIGGTLQRELQSNWRALGFPRKPVIFIIKLYGNTESMASYIQAYLATGIADAVIWQFNTGNLLTGSGKPMGTNVADDTSWWLPVTQQALHTSAQALAKSDTYFLPVLQPMPYEVSLSESSWYRTFDLRHDLDPIDPAAKNYNNSHAFLLDLLKKETAVPVLDLWSLMQAEEQKPDHQALFTTRDVHFSDYGNAFVGHAIATALELAHPWRK